MKQSAENLLPLDILRKAIESGNELSWRFMDIPSVVSACEELNFALLGGQVKVILPDGTCELPWLHTDPNDKGLDESWTMYSQRSCKEFMRLFEKLIKNNDFEKEGIQAFKYLANKKRDGVNISDYIFFTLYPVTEDEYNKDILRR